MNRDLNQRHKSAKYTMQVLKKTTQLCSWWSGDYVGGITSLNLHACKLLYRSCFVKRYRRIMFNVWCDTKALLLVRVIKKCVFKLACLLLSIWEVGCIFICIEDFILLSFLKFVYYFEVVSILFWVFSFLHLLNIWKFVFLTFRRTIFIL